MTRINTFMWAVNRVGPGSVRDSGLCGSGVVAGASAGSSGGTASTGGAWGHMVGHGRTLQLALAGNEGRRHIL